MMTLFTENGSAPLPHAGPAGTLAPVSAASQEQFQQWKLLQLMETTGYKIEQFNGQRKTGPPDHWVGPPPAQGCEIFIGKIPRDLFEDELFPLLIKYGHLYELRLMMDFSGTNRGFGFAQFATPEEAQNAVDMLDGYRIRPNKYLGVMKSLDNRRLFVGGLPKERTKEEITKELRNLVMGIVDVILYSSVVDKTKNRGFAFVEFESHRTAAIARRKMIPGGVRLWGHELAVDWAEPEPQVPDRVMKKVKILYMRNLLISTTEETLKEIVITVAQIPETGIERVKRLKDFAFLHFSNRNFAEQALHKLNQHNIEGSTVTVVWAKPPQEKVCEVLHYGGNSDSSLIFQGDQKYFRHIASIPESHNVSEALGYCAPLPAYQRSFWETLVTVCGSHEPKIEYTSFHHPVTGSILYQAKLNLPFIGLQPQSVHGMLVENQEGAREWAARLALEYLNTGEYFYRVFLNNTYKSLGMVVVAKTTF